MGWTETHYPKGMKFIDFVKEEFEYYNKKRKLTILDAALLKRREGYVACEAINKETGERIVFAVAMMIRWHKGYYNICYKDMDESMGPNISNCPERILKLLTPTKYEYAIEWRKRCWDNIKKKKELRKIWKKINPGTKLKFKNKLHFVNGYILDEGTVTRKTKNTLLLNGIYRVKRDSLITYGAEIII